ncbi:MAG: hypothetical protein M1837_005842 [Sclerophora amabilis]|nr:MAG: hypothetical protein M1837_005842 [Sclerophora amabilis]
MAKSKKRKYELANDVDHRSAEPNIMGVGATLSKLRNPDLPVFNLTSQEISPPRAHAASNDEFDKDRNSEEWETNPGHRHSKKRRIEKKRLANYPTIVHSPQSRLQASVKLHDIQGLVLYLLADGTAPQWISVKHHTSITKVVALMVPGLERGMFDGRIALGEEPLNDDTDQTVSPEHVSGSEDGHTLPRHKGQKEHESPGLVSKDVQNSSPDHFYPVVLSEENLAKALEPLSKIFPNLWPVLTPGDDKFYRMHSPLQAMLNAPLPKSKEEKKLKGSKPPREGKTWKNQRTPLPAFLATTDQLRDNNFPVHPALLHTTEERTNETRRRQTLNLSNDGWVDTRVEKVQDGIVPEEDTQKDSLTVGRDLLAMDCEMCKVEGGQSRLARVSLVNWDGELVLDELVKPQEPIVDYLTPFSGITKAMLEPVQTTLADIQKRLLDILHPRTILTGHSLESDLAALRMTHPFIIDTSMIYPHPRGPPLKSSLKWLAQKYLEREIQKGHGTSGHDSVEDARACLDLVKQKCEKGPMWGTSEASTESIFKRLQRATPSSNRATGSSGDEGKSGAVVDWGHPERSLGISAKVCIGCKNDEEVVEGVSNAIKGNEDGSIVSGGGVDYVWARLRDLEVVRGWGNQSFQSGTAELPVDGCRNDGLEDPAHNTQVPAKRLGSAVSKTVANICAIFGSLPPCTAFIVYSGSGDPREMSRLQALQQQFRREYQTKKWDELSVRWTDTEDQQLRAATRKAREGIAFITVK